MILGQILAVLFFAVMVVTPLVMRSRGSQEIMAHLKTRPGEPYREEQVMADFQSLLAQGFLDRLKTRVRLEEGVRGGVIVVLELVEFQPK